MLSLLFSNASNQQKAATEISHGLAAHSHTRQAGVQSTSSNDRAIHGSTPSQGTPPGPKPRYRGPPATLQAGQVGLRRGWWGAVPPPASLSQSPNSPCFLRLLRRKLKLLLPVLAAPYRSRVRWESYIVYLDPTTGFFCGDFVQFLQFGHGTAEEPGKPGCRCVRSLFLVLIDRYRRQ